jgi:hypothetical protein
VAGSLRIGDVTGHRSPASGRHALPEARALTAPTIIADIDMSYSQIK